VLTTWDMEHKKKKKKKKKKGNKKMNMPHNLESSCQWSIPFNSPKRTSRNGPCSSKIKMDSLNHLNNWKGNVSQWIHNVLRNNNNFFVESLQSTTIYSQQYVKVDGYSVVTHRFRT